MTEQNVNVKIRVSKTGSGATDTVNDLKKIKAEASGVGSSLKSAFGGMSTVLGGMGLAFGAATIVKFARDTVMAASAANESVNKMQVVFGSASNSITKFSANSARDLGMSKQQAIEASATFGNLFTSMGLGQGASADMSAGIVQLAADLGSFNNIPIDVMLEKLRSGMVGEVEPLRAVGINLSAAEVKAKALAMGLADANGEVSQAATLQARYAVMLAQSKNAQGDFARTSDGLANSMKIADAEVANLKVQLGQLVIKPYTVVVHVAASGLEQLNTDLQAMSGNQAVRLPALQKQLAEMQKSYADALANGADAQAPVMTQMVGSIAAISEELRNAKSNAEIAGDAGVSAATRTAAAMYAANAASIAWGDAGAGAGLRIAAAADAAKTAVENLQVAQGAGASMSSDAWSGGGSGAFYGAIFKNDRAQDDAEADAAAKKRQTQIQLAGDTASRAADAVKAKWSAFASAVTTALDDARNKAKGLFDLGGGGAGGVITEPGKGGPFEALYRITDVAATMAGRAPGADTAKWQSMYGGIDYSGIAKNFQSGNLMAPGVFENIDWGMLGQQAQQQQQASKISTYAGQAAANLTKAGKPLTAESMAAEIDKLAAKDKASLVPELQNVARTVTDTGKTADTNAASMISWLGTINGTLTGKLTPPTTTPPVGPPAQTIPLFAGGTAYAPGGMAIIGERGPELVNLPQGARVYSNAQTRGMRGGNSEGQFMTELAKALNVKATTAQQAGAALADMLVNAAALNVQTSMLQQLSRR